MSIEQQTTSFRVHIGAGKAAFEKVQGEFAEAAGFARNNKGVYVWDARGEVPEILTRLHTAFPGSRFENTGSAKHPIFEPVIAVPAAP